MVTRREEEINKDICYFGVPLSFRFQTGRKKASQGRRGLFDLSANQKAGKKSDFFRFALLQIESDGRSKLFQHDIGLSRPTTAIFGGL